MAQAAASGSLSAQIRLDGAALASALATGALSNAIIYARRGYIATLLARSYAASIPKRDYASGIDFNRDYEVTT